MNRDEFMKELEYLLQDIQEEDKADALQYYIDYFEEAGPEEEKQVIREFGSPERVAAIIRADVNGHLEAGGEFTESGYQDQRFRDPNYQIQKRYDQPEQRERGYQKEKSVKEPVRTNSVLKIILWVVLVLIASPIILSLGGALLGIVVSVGAVILALLCASGIVAFALLVSGFAVFIYGFVMMFANAANGLLCMGGGLICLGIGLFFLILTVLILGKLLPWAFRGVIDSINKWFNRRREKRV